MRKLSILGILLALVLILVAVVPVQAATATQTENDTVPVSMLFDSNTITLPNGDSAQLSGSFHIVAQQNAVSDTCLISIYNANTLNARAVDQVNGDTYIITAGIIMTSGPTEYSPLEESYPLEYTTMLRCIFSEQGQSTIFYQYIDMHTTINANDTMTVTFNNTGDNLSQ